MKKTDLLIIGAGPAGCSAAIYAVRAGLKTVIAGGAMPGGQLLQTSEIENYAGFIDPVGGFDLMERMHKQCKRLGVEMLTDEVAQLKGSKTPYTVVMAGGEEYEAASVIIATGARARWLGVPNEEKFKGHGLSACATCDGFFMLCIKKSSLTRSVAPPLKIAIAGVGLRFSIHYGDPEQTRTVDLQRDRLAC